MNDVLDEALSLLHKIYRINNAPGVYLHEEELFKNLGITAADQKIIQSQTYLLRDVLSDFFKYLEYAPITSSKKFKITPAGFSFLFESSSKNKKSNQTFCAMWFDTSTEMAWNAIKLAISDSGHQPKRLDEHDFTGDINAEMIVQIKKSKFLIADFTGDRGGVYWEAGYAHALGLPVFYTCNKDSFTQKKPHFDIEHYNFILWEKEKLNQFREMLKNRIINTIS